MYGKGGLNADKKKEKKIFFTQNPIGFKFIIMPTATDSFPNSRWATYMYERDKLQQVKTGVDGYLAAPSWWNHSREPYEVKKSRPRITLRAYRLALLAFVRSAKYSNKEKDLWEAAELSVVGRALLVINRLVPMNEEIKWSTNYYFSFEGKMRRNGTPLFARFLSTTWYNVRSADPKKRSWSKKKKGGRNSRAMLIHLFVSSISFIFFFRVPSLASWRKRHKAVVGIVWRGEKPTSTNRRGHITDGCASPGAVQHPIGLNSMQRIRHQRLVARDLSFLSSSFPHFITLRIK